MQPEPTAISIQQSNSPTQEQPSTASQYGFQPLDFQPYGSLTEQRRGSTASSLPPDASHASFNHDGATQEPLPGLKFDVTRDDHAKPTVYRISEYENALSSLTQKKGTGGPYFKVVKSGSTFDGPRLENFPNGSSVPGFD
jgi:hypothetical protein